MNHQEKLEGFLKEASEHEEIVRDLKEAGSDREAWIQKALYHAKRLGYNLSEEELQRLGKPREDRELSDSELNQGSGGDFVNDMASLLATWMCN